jgi:hypothetical protein
MTARARVVPMPDAWQGIAVESKPTPLLREAAALGYATRERPVVAGRGLLNLSLRRPMSCFEVGVGSPCRGSRRRCQHARAPCRASPVSTPASVVGVRMRRAVASVSANDGEMKRTGTSPQCAIAAPVAVVARGDDNLVDVRMTNGLEKPRPFSQLFALPLDNVATPWYVGSSTAASAKTATQTSVCRARHAHRK